MNKAVIGLGFGDEGKGHVVSYLSSQADKGKTVVARYCGGHQAGHTVNITDNTQHVFSNFGSGSHYGLPTYWMKQCTVSPMGLFNEYQVLLEKNIKPVLFIDKHCPITTPYDKAHNRNSSVIKSNGTCGVGFGATIQRENDYFKLHYIDLFFPDIMKFKLKKIHDYYYSKWGVELVKNNQLLEFVSHCEKVTELFPYSDESFLYEKDIIFEGAQGLLLDKDIGFFPHVTYSNTGSRNIKQYCPDYYLVTRAYQTRHGNGPMANKYLNHKIWVNPKETNETNQYQGEFKRTILDIDYLEYAIEADNIDRRKQNITLCITCVDHIQSDIRFTRKGQEYTFDSIDKFIKSVCDILKIDRCLYFSSNTVSYLQK